MGFGILIVGLHIGIQEEFIIEELSSRRRFKHLIIQWLCLQHVRTIIVIIGNQHLYDVMKEKDAIYEKPDFSDVDGLRAADLEAEFAEMNGYDAEYQAGQLLNQLDISDDLHYCLMNWNWKN